MSPNPRAAAAFRVLELASEATAPCGRLLAEAGADVVKVEPPGGTPHRARPPTVGPAGAATSAYALFHDTGKRGITLDLDAPGGRELFLRLVAGVDVVIEGLAPGELARRDLAYETLCARNPGLVLVSITPFGQDGPYSRFCANDLVVFAMGGMMFISGLPDRPPVVAPDQQSYLVAGTHGALATLAVLWGRGASGRGDWVDVSMFECLAAQENTLTNYLGPGRFARRNGSQHRTANPGRIFACRDGYAHIYIGREKPVWERFVAWLGNPPELADETLADIDKRWENVELVTRVTERILGQRTRAEIYDSAQASHLPCVPVYSPAEFLADPQTVSHELVVEVRHPDLGAYRTLRPPLALATGDLSRRHAPRPGEHNAEVYAALAGLGPEELAAYREARVV